MRRDELATTEKDAFGSLNRMVRPVTGAPSIIDGLPSEWQADAVNRLSVLAGTGVVLCVLGFGFSLLRQPNLGVRAGTERPSWVLASGLALSLCVFAFARARRLPDARLLDLGLGYLVLSSLLASIYAHALPYAASDVVRGVSPIVPAVLVMAIFIPNQPKRMTIAALLAALMDPLGLAVTIAMGGPTPPWNLWLWLFMPTALSVPMAAAASMLLNRIAKTVRQLRAMGNYQLIDRLGAGGMGEVWRAEHRSLKRPAAVKLVRPELLGATDEKSKHEVHARFAREAQATASLTSPHVVEVYDFGVADDGSVYYVMELLDGLDLETLIRASGALPPERAAFLLRQLLLALRDAHDNGLVHRDVKPANMLVATRGGMHDFVKLLDFGLVRPVDAAKSDDAPLTLAGAIAGTPGYLAPEAAEGREVDGRADLYAVGCIAYRLLAGRDVFESTNVFGLIVQHATSTPEPLETIAKQPIPEAFVSWVHRALEKPLAARWQSAAEMIDALDAMALASAWSNQKAEQAWAEIGDLERAAEGVAPTLAAS